MSVTRSPMRARRRHTRTYVQRPCAVLVHVPSLTCNEEPVREGDTLDVTVNNTTFMISREIQNLPSFTIPGT